MSEIDWRLAGNVNPFAEFASGLQQGMDNRRQRERDAAYGQSVQLQQQRADRLDAESERRAQMEDEAQRLSQVKQVLSGLSQVPEGQRLAAFQRAAPMLARFGLDAKELATTTEEELSNASLSMLGAKIDSVVEEYTLAPGAKRYQGGKMIAENPVRPSGPISVPQGNTLVDPETFKPLYTAPKTYAPRRGGGSAAPKLPPGFILD